MVGELPPQYLVDAGARDLPSPRGECCSTWLARNPVGLLHADPNEELPQYLQHRAGDHFLTAGTLGAGFRENEHFTGLEGTGSRPLAPINMLGGEGLARGLDQFARVMSEMATRANLRGHD